MAGTPRPGRSGSRLALGLTGLALLAGGLVLWEQIGGPARAADPSLKDAAGFQTTEKLLVTINLTNPDGKQLEGTLRAELIDADGKVVGKAERSVKQSAKAEVYRFEFATPKLPPDKLTARFAFGDSKTEKPLGEILLVKAHETTLVAGQEFHAGSTASLRCSVHGVKSITETIPLPGASVEVKLRSKEGKVYELCSDKADAEGVAAVKFQVPDLPAGTYTMEVATKSALGQEKLERDVKIKDEPKILLVTDKPLYQPGQVIHIRALSLGAFDLKPVAGGKLIFEVEDSKGNKVFKRERETSEHGIAAVDFQLATEVNQGDYRIRAILGQHRADKTVTVKPYVLPKFKANLSADKKFYLPKETIKADLQTDYFFGKPVAGAKVKVTASTFDVQFKEFQTWEGKTDKQGHAKFEITLPDYFVGQPLAKGDALVKLEVKVTDTADHSETINKTYNVSNQPLKVSLIPEAGKLVPGVENRVFAAVLYPDGSPAKCDVKVWLGKEAKGKPVAELKTSDAGLAEFVFTPEAKHFRPGPGQQQNIEILGGTRQVFMPKNLLDLHAVAKDDKGSTAKTTAELSSEPLGDNVLLRLDKAVYKGGDNIDIDIRTSGGLPTVYLDVIRGGQTMLTQWLDVKDGKARHKLTLPPEVFGTVELHAYQMLAGGEIIRDARVIYVQPADELKVKVEADKKTYLPGENGSIRFVVTDSEGKPTAAALGVIIVDEAVYALQEMQPGLEKVYFTLQEELLKPQAQAVFKPAEGIPELVIQPALPVAKQQIAQVLLTAAQPKPPARWTVNPALERRQKYTQQLQQVGWALFHHASQGKPFAEYDKKTKTYHFKDGLLQELAKAGRLNKELFNDPLGGKLTLDTLAKLEKDFTPENVAKAVMGQRMQSIGWSLYHYANQGKPVVEYDKKAKEWRFRPDLLGEMVKAHVLNEAMLADPLGGKLTLKKLAALDKEFTPDNLAKAITVARTQNLVQALVNQTAPNPAKYQKDGKWEFPPDLLDEVVKRRNASWRKDAWGEPFRLVKLDKKRAPRIGWNQFDYYDIVSGGPDRKFGTDDDVKIGTPQVWQPGQRVWLAEGKTGMFGNPNLARRWGGRRRELMFQRGGDMRFRDGAGFGGGFAGGVPTGAPPPRAGAAALGGVPTGAVAEGAAVPDFAKKADKGSAPGEASQGAPVMRLREYFPETMLWQPALITDDKGVAVLPLTFADSITTWRLSASASSAGGLLGGVTAPLRVFQDFFVDLDLPIALTQNDEVAFPVAIYNYMKEPQTVRIELKRESWFELVKGGLTRTIDLKPGEVTSIKFRIRAKRIGNHPLTVTARGTKMSDAVKRLIEVVPDGQKVEQVVTDRLTGKVTQTIIIPDNAIEDASKLIVKVYPGVFSQVLEGVEGMLRLPGG